MRRRILRSKVVQGAVEDVVQGIVIYMETAKAAIAHLQNDGRLKKYPMLGFRLQVEVMFCASLLLTVCKVTPTHIAGIRTMIHKDSKKFQKEVEKFADAVVPKTDEDFRLYNQVDLRKEIMTMGVKKTTDRNVRQDNVLITSK